MHRSQNRFSGKASAHYYYSHFHRNQYRNRNWAVETHHKCHLVVGTSRSETFFKFGGDFEIINLSNHPLPPPTTKV